MSAPNLNRDRLSKKNDTNDSNYIRNNTNILGKETEQVT
jgi:hypothetical protein